jgi:phosphatidylglycerol---prolipoprotein diacylglyceryl transferase
MATLYITWDVNPEIFSIGFYSLKWYGFLFAMAFVSGYLVLQRIFRREGLTVKQLDQLAIYVGVSAIVGARLGHCLFYQPEYYLPNPIEILKIWEGGLASHGAAVAILISLWLYERRYKLGFFRILDLLVLVIPLGGMFIRLGNLVNSEIIGTYSDLPWAFAFLDAAVPDPMAPRHPAQLYEAIAYLFLSAFLLLLYYRSGIKEKRGQLFAIFLVFLFGFRFLIEFIKEDQVAFESGMLFNMGQWLSLPFIILGASLYFLIRFKPQLLKLK